MKKGRTVLSLFLALALVLAMLPCALAETGDEATLQLCDAGRELGFVFSNPWKSWGFTASLMLRTLIMADANLEPGAGDLAESYAVSDDGLTYTFVLKDNLRWSDGEPLTAADVKWSLETMLYAYNVDAFMLTAIKQIVGANAYDEGTAESIEGIKIDGNTIVLTLEKPFSSFAKAMSQIAILPEHVLGQDKPEDIYYDLAYWTRPVTCGMYAVTDNVEDTYTVLGVNPYYEGAAPKIKRIIITKATDSVEAQAGKCDFVPTNSIDTKLVMDNLANFTAHSANVNYIRYLMFNIEGSDGHKNPAMADARVRKAVAYAVDWNTLVSSLMGSMAAMTTTGVLSDSKYYVGDVYSYNPDTAKKLLADAGYDSGYNFRILYAYSDQTTKNLLDGIAYYLSQVGINAQLVHTSNASQDLWITREFDMYYGALSAFTDFQWYEQYTKSSFNSIMDGNTYFAELVNKINTAVTEEEFAGLMKEAQMVDAELCYRIPVYSLAYQFYTSDRVSVPDDMVWGNPWYRTDYRFAEWEIVK